MNAPKPIKGQRRHRCQEITALEWKDRAPYLTAEKALWTLDWWETYRDQSIADYNEIMETMGRDGSIDARAPENPIMLALAAELRAVAESAHAQAQIKGS